MTFQKPHIYDFSELTADELATDRDSAILSRVEFIAERTEEQKHVAERLKRELERVRAIDLAFDLGDEEAEWLSGAAERALNPYEPSQLNEHGVYIGSLRSSLTTARAAHAELIVRLERDLARLESPPRANPSLELRIAALEKEIAKRAAAKAARLATLKEELAELGVNL